MDILYMVVPCYNEQEVLPETSKRLLSKLMQHIESGSISDKSRIMFVDDGSKDTTWQMISELHEENEHFSGVKLSRNRGHQNAVLCGLQTAVEFADVTISLDADLQDDIYVIDQFIEKYKEGCDIVYGVRSSRKTDTAFKRSTAQSFYKLLDMFGVEIVYNHADYRLMSKRAVEAMGQFKEVNLFLRGIVPLIGFKSATVEYERHERFAGESKYPLKKMLALAFDGITSFSIKPIRFIFGLGCAIFGIGALMLLVFLIAAITGSGFGISRVILMSIWMIGGLQLIATGVIGEYIGKMYMETKARPRYIVDKLLNS